MSFYGCFHFFLHFSSHVQEVKILLLFDQQIPSTVLQALSLHPPLPGYLLSLLQVMGENETHPMKHKYKWNYFENAIYYRAKPPFCTHYRELLLLPVKPGIAHKLHKCGEITF